MHIVNPAPPTALATATPDILLNPNHKYVSILITVTVPGENMKKLRFRLLSVSSDEPWNGTGDGDKGVDWSFNSGVNPIFTESHTPQYSFTEAVRSPSHGWGLPGRNELCTLLRAERSGRGDGRVYTIRAEVMRPDGTVIPASVQVLVPKK